eukprot:9644837-Heterocapsa_arctica.AAC.1
MGLSPLFTACLCVCASRRALLLCVPRGSPHSLLAEGDSASSLIGLPYPGRAGRRAACDVNGAAWVLARGGAPPVREAPPLIHVGP